MSESIPIVAIVPGRDCFQAGFVGEDAPRSLYPTVIGRSIHANDTVLAGDDALNRVGRRTFTYPYNNCMVTDWNDMGIYLEQLFYYDLRSDPDEFHLCFIKPTLMSMLDTEKMIQILFEKFTWNQIAIIDQSIATLHVCNSNCGVVVDCGYDGTSIVPVYNGQILRHAIQRFPIGGEHVEKTMMQLFDDEKVDYMKGNSAGTSFIKSTIGDYCYIADDYNVENTKQIPNTTIGVPSHISNTYHITTDYATTTLYGSVRYYCPEVLFQPSLLDKVDGYHNQFTNQVGIHQSIHDTISKCDIDIRNTLYNNIVLCGGTSHIKGFSARLKKEMISMVPPNTTVNTLSSTVIDNSAKRYFSWVGGSLLVEPETFSNWITRDEYDEYGAAIILRKGIE